MTDDLTEKVSIGFSRVLHIDELKKMMEFLARNNGYHFNISQTGFFNARDGSSEDYITQLSGTVAREKPFGLATLSFKRAEANILSYFEGARFFTAPGYDWEELPENERDLITSLKKDITEYLKPPRGMGGGTGL